MAAEDILGVRRTAEHAVRVHQAVRFRETMMEVYKTDSRGNPTHYKCNTVLGSEAIVFVEYDYSNPKKVDAHVYRMIFPGKGKEIEEARKWPDGN